VARADVPRLMLVTRGGSGARGLADAEPALLAAVRGGVRCVVVREPQLDDQAYRAAVGRLRARVPCEVAVLVHGRPAVAREMGLGLHLPAGAPPVGTRGTGIYGRSVHDDAELGRAVDDGADYVVVGTIFPTSSKPGRNPAGVALVERLRRLAPPDLPILAIGGITVSRVPQVIRAGAHGVAVCGAVLGAPDPERVAQALGLALVVATGGSG